MLLRARGVSAVAALLMAFPGAASTLVVETPRLVVADRASLSDDRLRAVAAHAQETLDKLASFWTAEAVLDEIGKIRVVTEPPFAQGVYSSVLVPLRGSQQRTVRVFGAERTPHMLAHKLTTALFPHRDKLVRNMMGIPTEELLGNALAFPGCGFSSDDWALALKDLRALVPLAEFGPEEASWGHSVNAAGTPRVSDRVRQTTGYVQSGSFGNYLLQTYGVAKIRAFYQSSQQGGRPWRAVFGEDLPQLVANWLTAIEGKRAQRAGRIALVVDLFKRDPIRACADLQLLVLQSAQK